MNGSDILFLSNEELVEEMEECADIPDRAFAHARADEILVVALLRAADDDLPSGIATELVGIYHSLDKWFG